MSAPWQAPATTPAASPERVRRELLDLAEHLAAEFAELPTGSVLRCVSRAVRSARLADPSLVGLPARVESLARNSLLHRLDPAVPQPRFERRPCLRDGV